ncbi:MAG TPA: MFS transporter [Blastocatellia bacterium]|nr:MFS transporter [Blastocatellia bacterium]
MNKQLRWSFSVMMFLQYMIWGAWSPDYTDYLQNRLGFSGLQSGSIFSLLPIGCMLAPVIAGQLADRYFATEKLLAVLHLAGGVLLMLAARMTDYRSLWLTMLGWAILYAPTLALTNSICFHHMPEAEKQFGLVRVWGTIGWIAAGATLSKVLRAMAPGLLGGLGGFDGLWLAGIASLILGLFSFALPHTPPAQKGGNPWAFLGAIKMLRDPQFAIFMGISFVVATELMFYYVLTAPFLYHAGVKTGDAPFWMAICAQGAEILTMLALPWMMMKWGLRKTMTVGILAWPIRYAVFALGGPLWLVIAALTLHGLCYVCFFTASYIYVNQVAEPDIRASAQGLITFVTLGAGLFLGSWFAGFINDQFTVNGRTDYTKVFLVPLALTVICAIVFMAFFRERGWKPQPASA